MKIEVAVLVAGGQHPATDRPRRAAAESTALSLALRLAPKSCAVVYAGPDAAEVLPWYACAADIPAIHLRVPRGMDPTLALAQFARDQGVRIVLCGVRAESGFSSGMTPYRVAAALDWPVLPAIDELSSSAEALEGVQTLPGGRQRKLRCTLPALVTVAARDVALPFAWARYRHAAIEVRDVSSHRDPWQERVLTKAHSRSPAWQRELFEGSAVERLSRIFDVGLRSQQQIATKDADVAATAILNFLCGAGAVEWQQSDSCDVPADHDTGELPCR